MLSRAGPSSGPVPRKSAIYPRLGVRSGVSRVTCFGRFATFPLRILQDGSTDQPGQKSWTPVCRPGSLVVQRSREESLRAVRRAGERGPLEPRCCPILKARPVPGMLARRKPQRTRGLAAAFFGASGGWVARVSRPSSGYGRNEDAVAPFRQKVGQYRKMGGRRVCSRRSAGRRVGGSAAGRKAER